MSKYEDLISILKQVQNEEDIKVAITSTLLDTETTNDDIEHIFSNQWISSLIDLDLLKKCIDAYATPKKYFKLKTLIISKAQNLYFEKQEKLNAFILELTTSDNGYKREIGRNLWEHFELGNSNINILSYPEEIQVRLMISLTQGLTPPQCILPKLFSLFNSKSITIREGLLKYLVMYTLNYLGTAKRLLQEQEYMESKELNEYKSFIADACNIFDLRNKCQELNLEYAMPEIYDLAQKTATEYIQKQMNRMDNKNEFSILQLFKKVELGRGGGWRNQHGVVQPLAHISISREIPAMIHFLSPLEENDYIKLLYADWSETIKENE